MSRFDDLPIETQRKVLGQLLVVAQRANMQQKTRKLQTQLENKLRRLFAQQGVKYLNRLDKYKQVLDARLIEAITDDDFDVIFDTTAQSDRMASSIQDNVESAVQIGANALLEQLGNIGVDYAFDLENPRAVEYLDDYGATQVAGIGETSKQLLRDALTNATEQGFSYQKTSQLIRKLFSDWSTKRAKLIAVTEIGNAYQEGNLIVGLDLQAAGLGMQKSWLTRGDDKVEPDCQANGDQGWINVDEPFSSGVMRPLDHPRCRCVMLMRVKPDASTNTE